MSSQHYEKEFSKALVQLERTGKATFNDFLEFLALSIRFLSMPDQSIEQRLNSIIISLSQQEKNIYASMAETLVQWAKTFHHVICWGPFL